MSKEQEITFLLNRMYETRRAQADIKRRLDELGYRGLT